MISFIVPALNEERNIEATVQTIVSAAEECSLTGYEIILIDDGSTDGTFAVMSDVSKANPFVTLLRNERNLGVGTSIRRGIAIASNPRFMAVPGDNDLEKAFIVLLLTFRDKADIIMTLPLNKEKRSLPRNIISMIYQMIQMITFDVYVTYINGPGIWPTEKARIVGLEAKRFSIISELNVKLLRSGCSYAELPGYFRGKTKASGTVTLKNLSEVIRQFLTLAIKVHVTQRTLFRARPTRVQIDFAADARDSNRYGRNQP